MNGVVDELDEVSAAVAIDGVRGWIRCFDSIARMQDADPSLKRVAELRPPGACAAAFAAVDDLARPYHPEAVREILAILRCIESVVERHANSTAAPGVEERLEAVETVLVGVSAVLTSPTDIDAGADVDERVAALESLVTGAGAALRVLRS